MGLKANFNTLKQARHTQSGHFMKNAKNLKKSTYMWFLEELAYKKNTY